MTPSKINFITKVNISKIKTGKLHLNSHQEPTLSQSTALPTNPIGIPITFEGQMPIILSNTNLAIFALIKGFFDFLRVTDSKRLTTNIYSHNKAKVNNKTPEATHAENYTEENKINDTKMETAGHDKMEHAKLDGITKLNTAKITPTNFNIVIYSLPHSLLSPNIFSVYVIQVSQSYDM